MSVDKVIEYVMKSPENTNPAVLKSLLDGMDTKPSGGLESNVINITVGNFDTEGELIPISSGDTAFVAMKDGVPISVDNPALRPDREYTYYGFQSKAQTPSGIEYMFSLYIEWPNDNLFNVFINETQIPFDNKKYEFRIVDAVPILNRTFNVAITPKG